MKNDLVLNYARALYNLGKKNKKELEYINYLQYVIDTLDKTKTNSDLTAVDIFSMPNLNKSKKLELLKKLILENTDSDFVEYINIVIQNHRINILIDILSEYKKIVYNKKNILVVQVISAYPLDQGIFKKIKEILLKRYMASDAIFYQGIDLNLIGGIKLIINDEIVIDDTILSKLSKLNKLIGE